MVPNKYLIPPLIVILLGWAIPLGVEAEMWSVHPLAGWAILPALTLAWASAVWIWSHNGLEWAIAKGWLITVKKHRSLQISVPLMTAILAAVAFALLFKLPPLISPSCAPDFTWRDEIQIDHHKKLDMPILIQFARLVPHSPDQYAMIVEAHGDNLRIFYVRHKNSKGDPIPYQLPNDTIGYKAINPGFNASFFVVAEHPAEVNFDIRYECLENGTR